LLFTVEIHYTHFVPSFLVFFIRGSSHSAYYSLHVFGHPLRHSTYEVGYGLNGVHVHARIVASWGVL